MTRLPEKLRRTLQKIVDDMRMRERVYGIGLFGSWSRGDASASSDVDLLILDAEKFDYEYVERVQVNGLFIDFDHVPKRWIGGAIPPELDQKLCELQILYDRDWSLTNTKLLMVKSYSSPERVDIRTEAHIVDCDIYLSRASSAFWREDFMSAYLFATVALENILEVLVEIALEPLSNSRFVKCLEVSSAGLGMRKCFDEYVVMAKLDKCDEADAREKLKLFKSVWDELSFVVKQNARALEASHFRVKRKLKYYLNPAFLQGMLLRVSSLADYGSVAEACHYVKSILMDLVENYVWLKSSVGKVKIDHTLLMRCLESLEKNSKDYRRMVELLDLDDVNRSEAAAAVEKTRQIALEIRKERKVLIKNRLSKG